MLTSSSNWCVLKRQCRPRESNHFYPWLLLLLSRFSSVQPFKTHGLQPTRLLCPWAFPGKRTGVGCHCLLFCPWHFTMKLGFTWTFCTLIDWQSQGLQSRKLYMEFISPLTLSSPSLRIFSGLFSSVDKMVGFKSIVLKLVQVTLNVLYCTHCTILCVFLEITQEQFSVLLIFV